jgi:hypothetical protein
MASNNNIRNVSPPNFPVAVKEYNAAYIDQLINVLRLYLNTTANAINAPKVFGSYYSTSAQDNPVINTAHPVKFDGTTVAYNTKIGFIASKIYVTETGVYNIQYSGQFVLSGGSNGAIYIWLRINDLDVANSGMKVVITGPNAEQVPSWNFIIQLQAGDYLEILWSSPDVDALLEYIPPATTPAVIPACPSFILCITWVSNPPA